MSAELKEASRAAKRRKSRLRLQVGDAIYPILRLTHDGLVLDATLTPHLRGLVDVYDGANHILQCLIVASTTDGDELICDFKRATAVSDHAALDFWLDENAAGGLSAAPRPNRRPDRRPPAYCRSENARASRSTASSTRLRGVARLKRRKFSPPLPKAAP